MNAPQSYASWLESMIHAREARPFLSSETLIALPVWSMRHAMISVGRKGLAPGGGVADLPVRIVWDQGSVIAFSGAQSISGRLRGLGWDEGFEVTIDEHGSISGLPHGSHDASEPGRIRERLIARGSMARWEMGMSLERLVRKRMHEINLAVGAEIGNSRDGALNPILLDEVVTDIHLGRDGEDRSVIHRAIDKCLEPDTFDKVEVSRYLNVRLRARATERIRDALGDPRIGFKVRSVYRDIKPSTLDELLDAYRKKYPNDRLGRGVAIAALGTEVAPSARADSFDEENGVGTRYARTEDGDIVAAP